MVGFCESLQMDAPVEVVNEKELYAAEEFGVRLFAINVSVGCAPHPRAHRQTNAQVLCERGVARRIDSRFTGESGS